MKSTQPLDDLFKTFAGFYKSEARPTEYVCFPDSVWSDWHYLLSDYKEFKEKHGATKSIVWLNFGHRVKKDKLNPIDTVIEIRNI